jgi:hypothetical protein
MGVAGWVSALDDLERQLTYADRLQPSEAAERLADWVPPVDLGPLPRQLTGRASDLAARQRALISRLTPQLLGTRQQLQLGRRIGHATTQPAVPLYIDVTA